VSKGIFTNSTPSREFSTTSDFRKTSQDDQKKYKNIFSFGSSLRHDQVKSFDASRIIRPIGKFRGHDRSASLKSN
jgi:hypothetical protein